MRCCDVCKATDGLRSVTAGYNLSYASSRDPREHATYVWYDNTADFCPTCLGLLKTRSWQLLARRASGDRSAGVDD